jgi:hypothetical protein
LELKTTDRTDTDGRNQNLRYFNRKVKKVEEVLREGSFSYFFDLFDFEMIFFRDAAVFSGF